MPTHLDYIALQQRQDELVRRAERVRQEREGLAAAPAAPQRRPFVNLFAKLRRLAQAPATPR